MRWSWSEKDQRLCTVLHASEQLFTLSFVNCLASSNFTGALCESTHVSMVQILLIHRRSLSKTIDPCVCRCKERQRERERERKVEEERRKSGKKEAMERREETAGEKRKKAA